MVHVDIAALRSIEREKEIAFDTIIDALETALLSAYKHTAHSMPHARVVIDRKTGEVVVWAQELDADGGLIEEFDDTPTDFGRVAAARPPDRSSCSGCETLSTISPTASTRVGKATS